MTTKAKNVTIDATVDELHVKTRNSKITLGTDAKIGNLVIPKGIPAKDIILDYENVKEKIEKINGQANPDLGTPGGGEVAEVALLLKYCYKIKLKRNLKRYNLI